MTRQELYELVWSRPLRQLAKDLQLSDVALAKRCRKLNIPLPGRGYWARITAGQTPPQTPLPERADTGQNDQPLLLYPSPQATNTDLRAASSPVKRTALALKRPWVNGLTCERGERTGPILQLDVSDDLADRALTVCEHLLISAESQGWRFVSRSPTDSSNFGCLLVDDEPLTIRILESRRRVDEAGSVIRSRRLRLHLSAENARDLEQIYKDYRREPLETQVLTILKGCLDLAKRIKAQREQRRQAESQHHQQQLRAKELADRHRVNTQLVRQLETQAAAWLRARLLRAYLRALERTNPQMSPGFLEWARNYIQHLDPLSPTPHQPDFPQDRNGFSRLSETAFDDLLRLIGQPRETR